MAETGLQERKIKVEVVSNQILQIFLKGIAKRHSDRFNNNRYI